MTRMHTGDGDGEELACVLAQDKTTVLEDRKTVLVPLLDDEELIMGATLAAEETPPASSWGWVGTIGVWTNNKNKTPPPSTSTWQLPIVFIAFVLCGFVLCCLGGAVSNYFGGAVPKLFSFGGAVSDYYIFSRAATGPQQGLELSGLSAASNYSRGDRSSSSILHPRTEEPAFEPAIFGMGCFWCGEHDWDEILPSCPGGLTNDAVVGYTSSSQKQPNPIYKNHDYRKKGYTEAVMLGYDSKLIHLASLLYFFFTRVDVLNPLGQFCDVAPSIEAVRSGEDVAYLAGFFYTNDEQRGIAERVKKRVQEVFDRDPVVDQSVVTTRIEPTVVATTTEDRSVEVDTSSTTTGIDNSAPTSSHLTGVDDKPAISSSSVSSPATSSNTKNSAKVLVLAENYHQQYGLHHSEVYAMYRKKCGRDERLAEVWTSQRKERLWQLLLMEFGGETDTKGSLGPKLVKLEEFCKPHASKELGLGRAPLQNNNKSNNRRWSLLEDKVMMSPTKERNFANPGATPQQTAGPFRTASTVHEHLQADLDDDEESPTTDDEEESAKGGAFVRDVFGPHLVESSDRTARLVGPNPDVMK